MLGALADEHFADRPLRLEPVVLVEQRDRDVAGARERARVDLLGAGDQAQERRLATAVCADDADALAGGDAERDVGEHRAAAVGLADAVEVEEVAGAGHRRPSSRTCGGAGPPRPPP